MAGASHAFMDEDYYIEIRKKIIDTRKWVSKELVKMGFIVTESLSNFLFISNPDFSAADIFKKLRESGILVRHFSNPLTNNYLRVSIGTDDEMKSFTGAIRTITGAKN